MRDRLKIFELLGVPPANLEIEKVEVLLWGKCIVMDMSYFVPELYYDAIVFKHFQIIFDDCQDMTWSFPEDEPENEWDEHPEILDLYLDSHEAFLIAMHPVFEITVRYGSYTIKKDW